MTTVVEEMEQMVKWYNGTNRKQIARMVGISINIFYAVKNSKIKGRY